MCEIVTVGWLTVDDIVLRDGTCSFASPGGGALYSAVGARMWNPSVGIHAAAGRPYAEMTRAAVGARGIDTRGIGDAKGNGLELWLLHESDADKQQLPKLSSSSAAEMDGERGPLPSTYETALGYHIAPQGPASSIANAHRLGGREAIVTMDILSDSFIDASLYRDLAFLDRLTAFLPSEAEIRRIWRASDIEAWLAEGAHAHDCHMVAKLGAAGSLVAERGSGRLLQVPPVNVEVRDTTGAGDAYCGGFVAGLVARRPIAECAAMATVSASYVVEASGALATLQPSYEERDARLRDVLNRIETA
ncbi:MAG: carbohydrate kinase family protein [Pararhizobium sp.]